jgi:hypothetical protein
MRIELLPIAIGLLGVAIGIVLVVDAAVADGRFIPVERRRRARSPRNSLGEGLLGAAIVLLGTSLLGGDSWPYTTLSVLIAVALGAAGVAMNWHYLRDMAVAPGRRSGESSLPAGLEAHPTEDQVARDEQSPASLS